MKLRTFSKETCPFCSGDLIISKNWFGQLLHITCENCKYTFNSEEDFWNTKYRIKQLLRKLYKENK